MFDQQAVGKETFQPSGPPSGSSGVPPWEQPRQETPPTPPFSPPAEQSVHTMPGKFLTGKAKGGKKAYEASG